MSSGFSQGIATGMQNIGDIGSSFVSGVQAGESIRASRKRTFLQEKEDRRIERRNAYALLKEQVDRLNAVGAINPELVPKQVETLKKNPVIQQALALTGNENFEAVFTPEGLSLLNPVPTEKVFRPQMKKQGLSDSQINKVLEGMPETSFIKFEKGKVDFQIPKKEEAKGGNFKEMSTGDLLNTATGEIHQVEGLKPHQIKQRRIFTKSVIKDEGIETAREVLAASGSVLALLEVGNPISRKAITVQLPRLVGEVGNLSKSEQDAFGGSEKASDRIDQALNTFSKGTLTKRNEQFLFEIVLALRESAIIRGNERLSKLAEIESRVTSTPVEEINFLIEPLRFEARKGKGDKQFSIGQLIKKPSGTFVYVGGDPNEASSWMENIQ